MKIIYLTLDAWEQANPYEEEIKLHLREEEEDEPRENE